MDAGIVLAPGRWGGDGSSGGDPRRADAHSLRVKSRRAPLAGGGRAGGAGEGENREAEAALARERASAEASVPLAYGGARTPRGQEEERAPSPPPQSASPAARGGGPGCQGERRSIPPPPAPAAWELDGKQAAILSLSCPNRCLFGCSPPIAKPGYVVEELGGGREGKKRCFPG